MKVGDKVTRILAGIVEMPLKVTAIDDKFIHCGGWKFDKVTGAEVRTLIGDQMELAPIYSLEIKMEGRLTRTHRVSDPEMQVRPPPVTECRKIW